MNEKIPVIGICWGAQLIARSFGMELVKMDKKIYGKTEIKFNN
jgi:GMP synthase-like glutamine amidotransferase